MMKRILLHAWSVSKQDDVYYLPYTHWIYLREIVKYYDEVVLLSPCRILKSNLESAFRSVSEFSNVTVYELPPSRGYISAIKHFTTYVKAYKNIKNLSTYYARYPVPFGWLQRIFGTGKNRIIHYVGDPIDAAQNNPSFSKRKKMLLITAFKPEDKMYDWACKGAKVYTNGHHIADRLTTKSIQATSLISSTLTEADFFFKEKEVNPNEANFVYLGYLRKAKGVGTVVRAFGLYIKTCPSAKLTIIGSGEDEVELKNICQRERIRNVTFLGHIDDRDQLNSILRQHDVFLFASLSEGSPRVVLEAMANGLAVISTPVGSLPRTFRDKIDIVFAEFDNSEDFSRKMLALLSNKVYYSTIRKNGNDKARSFTIDNFIKAIFL